MTIMMIIEKTCLKTLHNIKKLWPRFKLNLHRQNNPWTRLFPSKM